MTVVLALLVMMAFVLAGAYAESKGWMDGGVWRSRAKKRLIQTRVEPRRPPVRYTREQRERGVV